MSKYVRRLLSAAAVLGACAALPASATVINFESPSLVNFYGPGDSFTEQGFRMTVDFDFGTVDSAGVLPAATSGNNSQVYFNSNDGGLIVERGDGLLFNLNSFSAAFIPQTPASALATVIVAFATDEFGFGFGTAWLFGAAVNGVNPFVTYSNPADFASFTRIRNVEFFACSFVNSQVCTNGTFDSGQFALDNINVTTIPEPTSIALVLSALLAAGFAARRNVVR